MRHVALLLFLVAPAVGAQLPAIVAGNRIRVETGQPPKLAGTFLSKTTDSLFLAYQGASRAVEWATITRISTSGGRSHSEGAWRGIKIGASIGAVAALGIFGSAWLISSAEVDQLPWLTVLVASGALSGTLYGAIIGGLVGAEEWNSVYTRSAPQRTPGIGLALKF